MSFNTEHINILFDHNVRFEEAKRVFGTNYKDRTYNNRLNTLGKLSKINQQHLVTLTVSTLIIN